jgi:hypothetical protein
MNTSFRRDFRKYHILRHRYKIEVKNAELKYRYGLNVARASGIFNMELQATTTIFVVNMKRIIALIKQK